LASDRESDLHAGTPVIYYALIGFLKRRLMAMDHINQLHFFIRIVCLFNLSRAVSEGETFSDSARDRL